MHAGILIAELQWFRWKREVGGDSSSQSLGMSHDSLEVLDADDDVHVLLHVKVVEVLRVDRDCCLERLLQYFYILLACSIQFIFNQHYLCRLESSP